MATKRIQVQDTGMVQLQPAASPVQRFARPQAPAQTIGDSKLTQLASALKGIQPSVMNYLYHEQGRDDQGAADAARAMRSKEMINYKEAVKRGLPLSSNPFFTQAWKEQDGSVAADQFNTDLTSALATGPLAASRSATESDKLFSDFRVNWMKEQGVDKEDAVYLDAFTRKANNYETNARGHQATQIGRRRVEDMKINTFHEALGVFDDGEQRQLPPSVMADGLNTIADKLIAVGVDAKEVNAILLDATKEKALETNSTDPFLALDSVRTGSGYLGRTTDVKLQREAIAQQIGAKLEHADDIFYKKQERFRQDVERKTTASVYGYISEQRRTDSPINEKDVEAQLAHLGSYDFPAAEQLRQVIAEANKPEKWIDDDATIFRLTVMELDRKITKKDINQAFLDHKLTDPSARGYLERMERRNKEASDDAKENWRAGVRDKNMMDVAGERPFQQMFTAIRKQFGETDGVKMEDEKAAALNKALALAYTAAQDFRDKSGPGTSIMDDLKQADQIYSQIIGGTLSDMTGPVNVKGLTSSQPIPNTAVGRPTVYESVAGPLGNLGSTERVAGSKLEWQALVKEFTASRGAASKQDPRNTTLGQFLLKHGINLNNAADVMGAVSAQDSLYTESAPRGFIKPPSAQRTPASK